MGKMKKSLFTVGAASLMIAMFATGCASARNAMQEEYQRFAAQAPQPVVRCKVDKPIDDLGVAVGVNYNFAHKLMKEFGDATANHREYIGFLNDVNYYVEEEKFDEKAAFEKVKNDIIANDAKIEKAEDKVWPRVVAGIKATDALKLESKLQEIIPVIAANLKMVESISKLSKSFKGFDATTIEKGLACTAIAKQAAWTAECLVFLEEHFRRTLLAKTYAK